MKGGRDGKLFQIPKSTCRKWRNEAAAELAFTPSLYTGQSGRHNPPQKKKSFYSQVFYKDILKIYIIYILLIIFFIIIFI